MTVEALLEKARQALSDARYLQADARADAAISRAYYSVVACQGGAGWSIMSEVKS